MGGGRELNYKFSRVSDLYCYIFCYDKELLHNSIKEKVLDLAIRERFSTQKGTFFRFAKVFSAKFVAKTVIRECFCQTFRVFFVTRKFLPAKVSALKVTSFSRQTRIVVLLYNKH